MRDTEYIKGIDALFKKLNSIDIKEAEIAAAKEVHALTIERFESGTDPDGLPWANLAKGGRSFLFETGELQGTPRIDAISRDVAVIVGDDDAPYAFFHQEGTIHMPQRQILPDGDNLPVEYSQKINDAVAGYIEDLF